MKYYIMNGCNNFYCPQTKFAKVMFSQVSVCPPPPHGQILRDTVNKRAVRLPLECILVTNSMSAFNNNFCPNDGNWINSKLRRNKRLYSSPLNS